MSLPYMEEIMFMDQEIKIDNGLDLHNQKLSN